MWLSVMGLAVNLAGSIGPSLHALIKRCEVLAGGLLNPFADCLVGTHVCGRLVAACGHRDPVY